MPRSYSEPFLIELYKSNTENAGIALAMASVKANLPAKYVAIALGVSRMTVYSWFRGKPIRSGSLLCVQTFTDLVESDTAKGLLPALSINHAKLYIPDMIGVKL